MPCPHVRLPNQPFWMPVHKPWALLSCGPALKPLVAADFVMEKCYTEVRVEGAVGKKITKNKFGKTAKNKD